MAHFEPPSFRLPTLPVFDVITVKPSNPDRPGKLFSMNGRHVYTINTTVNDLITMAYGLHVKEIINGPDWFATEKFDLDGVPDVVGQPNAQFKRSFQSALNSASASSSITRTRSLRCTR